MGQWTIVELNSETAICIPVNISASKPSCFCTGGRARVCGFLCAGAFAHVQMALLCVLGN